MFPQTLKVFNQRFPSFNSSRFFMTSTFPIKPSNTISALILAGGKGERMGGVNKALVPFQGRPLMDRLLDQVRPFFHEIIIVVNDPSSYFVALPDVTLASDLYPDSGPLSGIHAGLKTAKCDTLQLLPCDTVGEMTPLFQRLQEAYLQHSEASLFVPHDGRHLQPLFSLIHKALLPSLETSLESRQLTVRHFFEQHSPHVIDCHDLKNCFANLNTPQDLKNLQDKTP
jgi:molybdenum cofactor guanylyltransferase